jgi:hypothetical protein
VALRQLSLVCGPDDLAAWLAEHGS